MNVNVGYMSMLDQPAIIGTRALMGADFGIGVDAAMDGLKVVYPFPHPLHHRSQEATKSIRLATAIDFRDTAIFNS